MKYKNILLIDDDNDDQDIFISALGEVSSSVKCTAISDAVLALDKLRSEAIIPDVIFLDLNMPLMNGQQFLAEIKKDSGLNKIPVIVLSTTSHSAVMRDCRNLGALDFITKPDDYNTLIQILRSI